MEHPPKAQETTHAASDGPATAAAPGDEGTEGKAATAAAAPQGDTAAAAQAAAVQNGTVQSPEQQKEPQTAAAATSAGGAPPAAVPPPVIAAPPAAVPSIAAAPAPPLAGTKRPYGETPLQSHASDGYSMGGGVPAPHSSMPKRPHVDPRSGGAPSAASVPRETVFRIVLDVVDTALIIGRGGNTVRQIEQTTGGRVKRLQEPPGAREQVVVVWSSARELPSPGRMARNTAQEALLDCVRRVVFQENAPMGQPMAVRMLINRTQEAGVVDNMGAIVADNPGITIEIKRDGDLPACALDNDVLVELSGEKYSLLAAVETLSHVLREHPILERPGGAPPALRATAGPASGGGYGTPAYGGYRGY